MSQEPPKSELILYRTEDGASRIDVRFEGDTAWLSLSQLADLFQRDKSVISRHLRNIFEERELSPEATVAKYATVQSEGARLVWRDIEYYNLAAALAVGYRVKSPRDTQFRQWASERLSEYMVKGFALDDARLKAGGGGLYFDELLARIRDIRSSEKMFWRKVLDIYATSVDYDPRAEFRRGCREAEASSGRQAARRQTEGERRMNRHANAYAVPGAGPRREIRAPMAKVCARAITGADARVLGSRERDLGKGSVTMVRNVRVFAVGCFIAVMLGVLAVSGSPAHAAVSITRGSASADLGQESPISVQVTSSVGSLQVALMPPEAVTAGAHWRRAGTVPWLASGATEAGLATGTCTVEFQPVAGWTAPSNQDLPILAGQMAVTTGSYVFIPTTGDLQVMLAPPEAVAAGAQWRRVGTVPWLASGATESGLVPGTYTVEFQAVTDWVAPANQNVPILAGQTTPTTGTYLLAPATGGLQVTLAPPEAIVAGAQWRRVGTVPWLASGTTELGLVAGTYTVEFQAVTGWIAPADQNAAIVAGQTTAVTGTYASLVEDPGALQVSLTPAAAVAAGAQWRRAGTTVWLDSGTTETGVATGECTVEFQPVPGWLTPDDASAQIVSRQTASASGNYEAYASGVLANYKISYKKCDMEQVDPFGLAVTAGLGGGASVKIQRLKELPANTDDVPGKYLYLLDCAGVERVDVDGGLASFYTDAPIGALVANDSVGSVASKNACVARIEVAVTLGSVRMVAVPGGTNTGLPVTRIASGGSSDKMLAIGLTGIVLEDLVTGQSVKSLSVTTKGFRDKVTGALVVATAGVGRIAPAAAADTSGTYALVAPRFGSIASTGAIMRPDELVSEGPVGRITGKSLYLGGALRPAILGWEDDPQRMLMKAESFLRISANHGVHGRFWAGFDAQGPTYTGTVGTVATTSGTLSGELRVAPGTVVKFRPDQGTIDVFTSN